MLRNSDEAKASVEKGGSQQTVGFDGLPGPFMSICVDAVKNMNHLYVLIIDEINRGDPARIFGELLYAIEYRGEEVQLANGQGMVVPSNLVVIGTMNSVDRSVALVDYALRRRFRFLRVDPAPNLIAKKHQSPVANAAADALEAVNERIRAEVDEEHQIGHSYFLSSGADLAVREDVDIVWNLEIRPQIAELFHGRQELIKELDELWGTKLEQSLMSQESAPDDEAGSVNEEEPADDGETDGGTEPEDEYEEAEDTKEAE